MPSGKFWLADLVKANPLDVSIVSIVLALIGWIWAQNVRINQAEADKKAATAANVTKLRELRNELQEIIGIASEDRVHTLLLKSAADFVGYEAKQDESFVVFSFKTINDLKLQHAIFLLDLIQRKHKEMVADVNSFSERRELRTNNIRQEIRYEFMIALLLAQSGNMSGSNYYLTDCKSKIESRLSELEREKSQEKAVNIAEIELHQITMIYALSVEAIAKQVEAWPEDFDSKSFDNILNKIEEFEKRGEIDSNRIKLLQSTIWSLRTVMSLAYFDKAGLLIPEKRKKISAEAFNDAETALGNFDAIYEEYLGIVPDVNFTNPIGLTKAFSTLTGAESHLWFANYWLRKIDDSQKHNEFALENEWALDNARNSFEAGKNYLGQATVKFSNRLKLQYLITESKLIGLSCKAEVQTHLTDAKFDSPERLVRVRYELLRMLSGMDPDSKVFNSGVSAFFESNNVCMDLNEPPYKEMFARQWEKFEMMFSGIPYYQPKESK